MGSRYSFKYSVGFDETTMGCATLGRTEREGRDRDEEMRRYAEFLDREGYTVTEVSSHPPFVRVKTDDKGIVRGPRKVPLRRGVLQGYLT